MVSKIRYLWKNLIDLDDAVLNESSQVDNLPVENLQHPFRTMVWRTTGCNSENVVIDLGQAQAVKAFALINHNLTQNAFIKIQGNSSDSWESPAVDESLNWHEDIIIKFFSGGSYQYWRLVVQDANNPDEYLEFGRLYLGDYFEPSKNFVYGWEYGLVDPSEIEESEGGQEFVDIKEQYRIIKVAFTDGSPLTDTDMENYEEMLRYCGRRKDLFLSLDYENKPNRWSFYGKFANTDFNFREFAKGYFSTGFDFKEAR
jgi:hypothetical protein